MIGIRETISRLLVRVHRDDDGATAVEYGILIALVVAVIMATVASIGEGLGEQLEAVDECIADADC